MGVEILLNSGTLGAAIITGARARREMNTPSTSEPARALLCDWLEGRFGRLVAWFEG